MGGLDDLDEERLAAMRLACHHVRSARLGVRRVRRLPRLRRPVNPDPCEPARRMNTRSPAQAGKKDGCWFTSAGPRFTRPARYRTSDTRSRQGRYPDLAVSATACPFAVAGGLCLLSQG